MYLPLNGSRGRTVQPGSWVTRTDDGTFAFLTDEDMGARYQVTDPQLPLAGSVEAPAYSDPVTEAQPDGGTPEGEGDAAAKGKAKAS